MLQPVRWSCGHLMLVFCDGICTFFMTIGEKAKAGRASDLVRLVGVVLHVYKVSISVNDVGIRSSSWAELW